MNLLSDMCTKIYNKSFRLDYLSPTSSILYLVDTVQKLLHENVSISGS